MARRRRAQPRRVHGADVPWGDDREPGVPRRPCPESRTGTELTAADVPHDLKVYPGARHSFFNDQLRPRPGRGRRLVAAGAGLLRRACPWQLSTSRRVTGTLRETPPFVREDSLPGPERKGAAVGCDRSLQAQGKQRRPGRDRLCAALRRLIEGGRPARRGETGAARIVLAPGTDRKPPAGSGARGGKRAVRRADRRRAGGCRPGSAAGYQPGAQGPAPLPRPGRARAGGRTRPV